MSADSDRPKKRKIPLPEERNRRTDRAEDLPPLSWFEGAGVQIDPDMAVNAIHRLLIEATGSRNRFDLEMENQRPKAALGFFLLGLSQTLHKISKDLGMSFDDARKFGLWQGSEVLYFAGETLVAGDTRVVRRVHIRDFALASVKILQKHCGVSKTEARKEVAAIMNDTISGVFPNNQVKPATIKYWESKRPKGGQYEDNLLPPETMSPEAVRHSIRYMFRIMGFAARTVEAFKADRS